MTPWWKGRMVGFDLETTGVDPETDRIVTAALVVVGGDPETQGARKWLADPGVPIPDGAAAVHGITTEHARKHGQHPGTVLSELVPALVQALGTGAPLVGFNVGRFDLTLLDRECRRHRAGEGLVLGENVPVVDAFVLDKHLTPFRRGSRKLGVVCEVHDVELGDDAHEAGADALAALRLTHRLMTRGVITRRVRNADEGRQKAQLVREWDAVKADLSLLHNAQKRWAWEQATDLADYFRRQGRHEDAMTVRGEWPTVPFEVDEADALAAEQAEPEVL